MIDVMKAAHEGYEAKSSSTFRTTPSGAEIMMEVSIVLLAG